MPFLSYSPYATYRHPFPHAQEAGHSGPVETTGRGSGGTRMCWRDSILKPGVYKTLQQFYIILQ